MTTAHVCTWERTGPDARAPFTLASELHFDPDEPSAVAHVTGAVQRFVDRGEADGLSLAKYGDDLAVLATRSPVLVARAITYTDTDPGEWTAERVRALALRIETPPLPIARNRRN